MEVLHIDISTLTLLGLIFPIFVIIIYIMVKTVIKKQIPDSRYNPFDYITGQSHVEFQEQKEQKEEDDSQGDVIFQN
ncbi:DUF3951 domain-containing protein [Paenibacillus sp. Soil750]|uniref:DUF3951 domain-containing protein n=1 Tax=Paenibacillus sp. Soil750 TaxID=1736398 RepID=UPI0006FC5198|nr:DUF3951 domain-containing protein [Paenibacillus sp. Soil750]KRE74738.1 hypothetical protein ASL11_05100 [Paenibacillus sp. Soil750]